MSEKKLSSNEILEAAVRAKVKFDDVEYVADSFGKTKEIDGDEKNEVRE